MLYLIFSMHFFRFLLDMLDWGGVMSARFDLVQKSYGMRKRYLKLGL